MPESLAELLQAFRSASRLSQEALAERAGLSTRTISDIETGFARTPRLVTVMLLAEALALSDADGARLQSAARKPGARAPAHGGRPATPLRPIRLVGRDASAEELGALVSRRDVRLLTLCGPPGVGKTSLAVRVASERAGTFADGVALVELAPVADPALVPAAVAQALGVRESGGEHVREAVVNSLRNRELLLVLDNVEHLTPIAAWLAEVLDACPKLTIMATSRDVLHLRAEHVYPVKPLDTAAAVALFVQRAQAVQPEFALTDANGDAVSAIVQRLEGLPLAIELAAPRLRILPPKALAARLDRRLPLLGEGLVDLPQRHQTMRSAIAWSYDLLAADEQSLFRQLSVLQGGGSLEAGRAIENRADEPPSRSFLSRVAALVEKSLLSLEEGADGEPRIGMLEMLREFAFERLRESDELEAARGRHAAYFSEFALSAQDELSGADQALWLGRLEREHPNVRVALQWALETGDVEFGLRLGCAIWRFWWLRGYLTEGLAWLRRFLDAASPAASREAQQLRGRALRALVVLLSALGDFDEALGPCEEAVRLQREIGDDAGLGASLTSLGIIMQFRGDLGRAEAVHEESLAIRRRNVDELGVATSLSNLASIAYTNGDLSRAIAFGEESVAIYRRLGHTSGVSHALAKLGLVAAQQRRYDHAERLFEECLALQRSLGNTGSMFYSFANLGAVAHKRGLFAQALARYREALELLDSVPNKAAIASTFEAIAATLAAAGDAHRAARILGAADTLRRTIGSPIFPAERADYDAAVDATRSALGEDAFAAEWQIGETMTLERTLGEARAEHGALP